MVNFGQTDWISFILFVFLPVFIEIAIWFRWTMPSIIKRYQNWSSKMGLGTVYISLAAFPILMTAIWLLTGPSVFMWWRNHTTQNAYWEAVIALHVFNVALLLAWPGVFLSDPRYWIGSSLMGTLSFLTSLVIVILMGIQTQRKKGPQIGVSLGLYTGATALILVIMLYNWALFFWSGAIYIRGRFGGAVTIAERSSGTLYPATGRSRRNR